MSADEIALVPYDPQWPTRFEAEKQLILAALVRPPLAIEHIGSTAVPGLAAKPVIDIIVLVADLADARPAIPALEAAGYSYWRDNPETSKLYLVKGLPPAAQRTHHLHIYADRAELDRHIAFRDRLRRDAVVRNEYEALKRELAGRYRGDRESYTDGKTAFIDTVAPPRG